MTPLFFLLNKIVGSAVMSNYNVNNKLRTLFLILLPVLMFNTGCTSMSFNNGTDVSPDDESLSVVFGQLNLEDARIDWVTFRELEPDSKMYHVPAYGGVFFHVGVPKSSVQVNSFGRNQDRTVYRYDFSSAVRDSTTKVIDKPAVYFVGTYKVIESDSNFDMVKTKTPSEKAVLTKVLTVMKNDKDLSRYKYQIRKVEERLKQLK